jgi:predicted MFS family arabinose efflux permease
VGPTFAGWLGERVALGTPFVVLAGLTALVVLVLLLMDSRSGDVAEANPPFRKMLRAARADRLMVTSLVLTLAVALMWMSADLLVPLRLDAHGLGASGIGLVFSAASIVFLGTSAITSVRAERYATVRVAAAWTAAYACTVLIAAAGEGIGPTVALLVGAGITTGVLVALTYPLGAAGAAEGGFSVAVVGALLNVVWAGSGLLGPTVGGVVAETVGDRLWFAALAAGGLAAATWMWRGRNSAYEASTVTTTGTPPVPNVGDVGSLPR